jgi:hypothetical protein
MIRDWSLALAVAVLGGCAGQKVPETRPLQGNNNEAELSQVVESALEADAGGAGADSLYAPYATILADGRTRRRAPRFAGIVEEGEVAIASTRLQSRGAVAWGDIEYRWVSARSNRAQVGLASFVLTPAQGRSGWWIVQLHSSTVR